MSAPSPAFPRSGDAVAAPLAEEREVATLLVRFGLPGLAASTLIAAGSLVVGWIAPASGLAGDPWLATLRDSPWATALGKVAVIVGVAWLLRTWLRAAGRSRGLSVGAAQRVGALSLLWSLPLLVAPALFSRDVFSYIAISRLAPAGIDPYLFGTGALPTYLADGADPLWAESPAPYGPFWMLLSTGIFHATGAGATAALVAFRLLAIGGLALLVIYLPRLAAAAGADPGRAAWLGVLNPLLLLHFTAAAHNDALMIGLVVAGVALAMERRILLGVVLVAAAGAIKLPALLALPFIGLIWVGASAPLRRRVAAWAGVAGITAVCFAVFSLVAGLGLGWAANLTTPTKVETWLSASTALGRIVGAVTGALGWASGDLVLTVARGVGTVAALAVISWLVLTADRRPLVRGLGLGFLAVVALGPVVQPWYLLWALPFLAAGGLSRRETRWAAGLSLGLAVYTLGNSAATTATFAAFSEGIAALLSLLVVGAMLFSSRTTREILLPETAPATQLTHAG